MLLNKHISHLVSIEKDSAVFNKVIVLSFCMMFFLQQPVDLELSKFRWKNRIMLIFSTSEDGSPSTHQKKILLQDEAGLLERDLLIFEILKDQSITELIHEKHYRYSPQFWRSLGPSKPVFTVLLIGKDGTEKLRSHTVVTTKELYAVIDAMPMRRSEMKNMH